ncbi:MAG: uracil-DNA glycosylase [Robiginitomaculum sp.]|nr:uracil-DNA glycosylase [Robiginitomaculum sp.]
MTAPNAEQALKSALQASHAWWSDMGVDIPVVPPAPPSAAMSAAKKPRNTRKAPGIKSAPVPQKIDTSEQLIKAAEQAKSAPTLEALKTIIEGFDAGILSDHARNIVFARGNPDADIMIIGEAPGRAEDESGKPFVCPAGQLLDKMCAAIDLDETKLYITNVCNWRPPGNRNPDEAELNMCAPFIQRHIELIAPKLVVIVGGISLMALTGKTGIMKTRGNWQELNINDEKTPAMPLYHPAFLLRRPELKKDAWRDLLAIRARIGKSG